MRLLAFLDRGADAGLGQHPAQAITAGADAFDQSPCGTSSTSNSPAIICRCVSGLRPIWLTIALRTNLAATSFPIPRPGMAVSLAMTVRFRLFCRTISSIDPLGRAYGHESADHQARAVRDHRHRLVREWTVCMPNPARAATA